MPNPRMIFNTTLKKRWKLRYAVKSTTESGVDRHAEWDLVLRLAYNLGEAVGCGPLKCVVSLIRELIDLSRLSTDNARRRRKIITRCITHLQSISYVLRDFSSLSNPPSFISSPLSAFVEDFRSALRHIIGQLHKTNNSRSFWSQYRVAAELDDLHEYIQDLISVFKIRITLYTAFVVTFSGASVHSSSL